MESCNNKKSRDPEFNNHIRRYPDSWPDKKYCLPDLESQISLPPFTTNTASIEVGSGPNAHFLNASTMNDSDSMRHGSENGNRRFKLNNEEGNEVFPESSEDEDARKDTRACNKFSVIQYNKARGSLPRRTRPKNKSLSYIGNIEIGSNLSLSEILLPTSASVSDSNERSEESKAKSGNEITYHPKLIRSEASSHFSMPPSTNGNLVTKLCTKMSNIHQTCVQEPLLHDVLDDMKLLQQAMNKLCRRAMLQTDDEFCTE